MSPQLTPEQRESIAQALYAGRKIEAIKQLRERSGLGLKEAKEIIDRLEVDLRAAQPDRFESTPSKSGCVNVLMLILTIGAAVLIAFIVVR